MWCYSTPSYDLTDNGDMPSDLPETNTSRMYLVSSSKFCGISQKILKTNLITVCCEF